jgi:chromosome segregation ATPase
MLIEAFFSDEKEIIEELEITLATLESQLNEAVEDVDYEPDSEKEEYINERDGYIKQLQNIEELEAKKKETKALIDKNQKELQYKLEVKRYGEIEKLTELNTAIKDIKKSLEDLQEAQNLLVEIEKVTEQIKLDEKEYKTIDKKDKEARADKKSKIDTLKQTKKELMAKKKEYKSDLDKLKKLKKDEIIINEQIEELESILQSVTQLTPQEAKELTLKKHHSLIENELNSGIKEELNTLVAIFENFKNKYERSLITIEEELNESQKKIDDYLKALGYLDE